jgi:hypothetical protein
MVNTSLSGGRAAKLVTGIDDHSRFVVVSAVMMVPSGRAVCEVAMTAPIGPTMTGRIPVIVATLATDGWDRTGLNE